MFSELEMVSFVLSKTGRESLLWGFVRVRLVQGSNMQPPEGGVPNHKSIATLICHKETRTKITRPVGMSYRVSELKAEEM